jgi:hypothetical protein
LLVTAFDDKELKGMTANRGEADASAQLKNDKLVRAVEIIKDELDEAIDRGADVWDSARDRGEELVEKGKDAVREAARQAKGFGETGRKIVNETKDELASQHR